MEEATWAGEELSLGRKREAEGEKEKRRRAAAFPLVKRASCDLKLSGKLIFHFLPGKYELS